MILIRMNKFDVVAAETEEMAVQHYERFRNKGRHEIVDLQFYSVVDPNEIVDFAMPWDPKEKEMTIAQAYREGKFTLPHVFTKKLRRL